MARVLDSVTLPIKKNGTKTNQNYINNPKSIAPQFSASTAYTAGQYVFYDKKLYRFKVDHAAGAWNAAHAEERTVGAEISALKQDFNQDTEALNSYNLIENLTLEPRNAHNVTWSWNGHTLTAKSNGAASSTENYSVFSSTTSMPKGFIPGHTYRVRHTTNKIVTKIYDYTSGTVELFNSKNPGTFTIPSGCAGMIIRFTVGSGTTVDETVYVCITDDSVKTNGELTAEIASVYNEYWSGMNAVSGHITKTKNLIDPSTLTDGYILVKNVPTEADGYFYSDYIKTGCVPIYYRDQGAAISNLISCYDKDKNFLGTVNYLTEGYQRIIVSDGSYPTNYYIIQPINGTEYVRVNGRYKSNLMLTLFFYPPYTLTYGESYVNDNGNDIPLKVAMFGDSITYGTNGNTAERVDKPITDYVQELTGFEVTNFGVGSMGWVSTAYNPQIAYDKISSEDLTGFDVITLCYGVNDSAATMGTYDSTDETTIMGQVNKCVKYIGAQNPGARIIIIAPWNGAKYGSFPDWRYASITSGGFTRAELSEELRKAAEYYYIGFISQKDSPLNGFGIGTVNNEKTGPYLGSDNVHPTPEGYKAMGEWLSAKITGIVI